ncbi:hypothetical protein WKS98_04770 [Lagierella sp. ICN-221743]
MIAKRFFQNKIHIYLLIISVILSSFVFTLEKNNFASKENEVYLLLEIEVYNFLQENLSQNDLNSIVFERNENVSPDYKNEDNKTIEQIDYYLTLKEMLSNIQSSFSGEEVPASKFADAVPASDMDKEDFIKGQKELIDLYKDTSDKEYNILDSNFMDFVIKRYDNLKSNDFQVIDENKVYFNSLIASKSNKIFNIPLLILLSLIGAYVLNQDKISLRLNNNLFLLKLKSLIFYIITLILFCLSVLFFILILTCLFGDGIGKFDYYYFNPQIINGSTVYIIEKPFHIFLYKGAIFIIFATICSIFLNFLFKLLNKLYFKVLVLIFSALIAIEQISKSKLLNFSLIKLNLFNLSNNYNFSSLSRGNIITITLCFTFAIIILFVSVKLEIKDFMSNLKGIYLKNPFTLNYYVKYPIVKSFPYLLLISLLFIRGVSLNNQKYIENFNHYFNINFKLYNNTYNNKKKILDNYHELFNSSRNLTDEERENLDEDSKLELDYYEEGEIQTQKAIVEDSKMSLDHYLSFKNRFNDPEKYYYMEKATLNNDSSIKFNPFLKDMTSSEHTLKLNESFVSEYEKREAPIPDTFLTPIFSNFDSSRYLSLDYLFREYLDYGTIKDNSSFGNLYNFYHLKLSLLLVLTIPLFTSIFLWRKNHIVFNISLKKDFTKSYIEAFVGSFIPGVVIYFSIMGLIFILSGVFYKVGYFNYPVAITFKDSFKFYSIGKYILLNALFSTIVILAINSLLVFFSLIFNNKTTIGIYFSIVLIGIIISFLTKYSLILPTTYLDSDFVLSGFLRSYHGTNGYSFILGLIILIFCSALLNLLSIKKLRRNICLKLEI